VSRPTREWKDVVAEKPVNEARSRLYQHLMEAEDRIAHVLYRHGISRKAVDEALDAIDERLSDDDRREDLYLAALGHYVEALGGRLEVRAVFGDRAIVVRRSPGEELEPPAI
jgi:hypothetical protein